MADATNRPSVLVGVLHVGEPSLPRVLDRIRAQADVDVELLEIGHHPEREAHDLLYRAFDDASASGTHDALVKVDADMELVEPGLLRALATMFRRHPDLDHIVLGVDDWFSGTRIQGMNAWRCGVRWTSPPPELFTDLPENTVSTKLKLMDAGRPLVLHAADPTDEQAVRYGLDRGLKAVESGKRSRVERLLEVIDHAERRPERGRRLAVAAIAFSLSDRGAATTLLAQRDPTATDLTALTRSAEDPALTSRAQEEARALLHRLPAGSPDDVAVGTTLAPRSTAARARGLAGRLVAMGNARQDVRERWRKELTALLTGPDPSGPVQPSRSSE